MIRSMTAFTRATQSADWGQATCEMRTVNHRYLDVNIRLPEGFYHLEDAMRAEVKKTLGRGKCDIYISLAQSDEAVTEIALNQSLLRGLQQACTTVSALFPESESPKTTDLLRWPGVAQVAVVASDDTAQALQALLQKALEQLIVQREQEGAALQQHITARLDKIKTIIEPLYAIQEKCVEDLRIKLRDKILQLVETVDEQRLEQECVIIAQKLDVNEELDRLSTHIDAVKSALAQTDPVGRRLDFLMQEMNREANTLGSKSATIELTQAGVDLKVLIEQMREQIQNIE
jgi:uncharacterized protein (TIGR00255 family)